MLIPIRTDYRMRLTPWVNYALLAVNIALYMLGWNAASQQATARLSPFMLHPDAPELFQFFTSMFLHSNFWHLAGNMLFLWVFGHAVNDRLGHLGYLMFYLAGGVLAGIGYVLLSGDAPVLGASGAISAVTGAYLVLLPRVRVTVLLIAWVLMPIEVSSLYFVLFQVVTNLWMTVGSQFGGNVAYVAHSTGYAYGIGLSAALLAIRALPRDPHDLLNLLRNVRRRQEYRRMVAGGYDPFRSGGTARRTAREVAARAVETRTPDTYQAREMELRRGISDRLAQNDLAGAAARYLDLVQVVEGAVLPRSQQLDVANQLMAQEQYPAAADAYERFLSHHAAAYEHVGDIYLMLGLIYGRYLQEYERAEEALRLAVEKLHDPRKLELARGDLEIVRRRRKA